MSMINSIQIKGVTHELPSGASAVVEGTDLKIQNGNTVSSAINPAGFTYSKNEMVVGKWIDGKPIYRRVGEVSDDADIIQQITPAEDGQGYIYTKGLIPILTSNTSASDTVGTAIRSDYTDIFDAWRTFNGDRTTANNCWYKNSKPCWLGFHFNNPVVIKSFFLRQEHDTPEYIRGFIFQASNDGEDWIDLGEYRMSKQTPGFEEGYYVYNNTEYTHYRWHFNDGPSGGISVQLAQMYDFNIFDVIYEYTKKSDAPNSFSPAMLDIVSIGLGGNSLVYNKESNTIGYMNDGEFVTIIDLNEIMRAVPVLSDYVFDGGIVSASGEYNSGEAAYKAFDGNSLTDWGVTHGSELDWLKVKFLNPTEIIQASVINRVTYYSPNYDIQYSDDDIEWTTVASVTDTASGAATDFDLGRPGKHIYWRILLTSYANSGTGLKEVIFYKFKYS